MPFTSLKWKVKHNRVLQTFKDEISRRISYIDWENTYLSLQQAEHMVWILLLLDLHAEDTTQAFIAWLNVPSICKLSNLERAEEQILLQLIQSVNLGLQTSFCLIEELFLYHVFSVLALSSVKLPTVFLKS